MTLVQTDHAGADPALDGAQTATDVTENPLLEQHLPGRRRPAAAWRRLWATDDGAAPLLVVLAHSFVAVYLAIIVGLASYFPAKHYYRLTTFERYLLALVIAVAVLPSPMASSWVLKRFPRFTARRLLLAAFACMSVFCALPLAVRELSGSAASPRDQRWVIFAMMAGYPVFSNLVWCVIEAYVTAARPGLEAWATSAYNIAWSLAAAVGVFSVSPVIPRWPQELLCAVGVAELVSCAFLLGYPSRPAKERPAALSGAASDDGELSVQAPAVADSATMQRVLRLHAFHKWLMPVASIVLNSIIPVLPDIVDSLAVRSSYQAIATSVWLFSRVVTFAALWPTSALWRGRYSVAALSVLLLLGGYAAVMLTPVALAGRTAAGVLVLCAGQAALGAGWAIIYNSGLAYAMEVGKGEVAAAAVFESFVLLGSLVSPLMGMGSFALLKYNVVGEKAAMNILVLASLGVGGVILAAALVHNVFFFKASRASVVTIGASMFESFGHAVPTTLSEFVPMREFIFSSAKS
eukprot:m51a1_g3160 hypothetical protein (521) ;mRNA; r:363581-368116